MAMSSGDDDDIMAGINITPLVDVCLVLVIIFMVTAPIMSDPLIKVNLPRAHTNEGEEKEKITITLGKDGRVALDDHEYKTPQELQDELKLKIAGSETKFVILRADAEATHGQLTQLMATAKDAGAASLTIATEHAQ